MKHPSSKPAWRRGVPHASPGKRAYVIGDVHGCLDLLQELARVIEKDNARRRPSDVHLIFLGDLIDRGPDSRQVLAFVRRGLSHIGQTHFIMGNHEEVLVRALDGEPELLKPWLMHGGFAFADSYGIPQTELLGREDRDIAAILRAAVPPADLEFMASFLDYIRFGDYLFVHAGIRPGVAFARQKPRDLHWIRDPFLGTSEDFGALVVHGHTVSEAVEMRPNRIGIDTGAYHSGLLTALMVEGRERSVLQTEVKELIPAANLFG